MSSIFWLENPITLCKSGTIIPKNHMSKEDQVNSITRLVIFIFLIMYLLDVKHSFLFLLLSIFFIIILYYLQKKEVQMEPYVQKPTTSAYFDYIKKSNELYKQGLENYNKKRYTVEKFPSYYTNERIESTEIVPNQTFVSSNQRLCGKANPKTLVAPVVAPPSYDWVHWKENDFVYPSIINAKRTQDYYGSGYFTNDEPVNPSIENYAPHSSPHRGPHSDQSFYDSPISRQQPEIRNPIPNGAYYENDYQPPQTPLDILGQYNGKYERLIENGDKMGSSNVVPKDYLRRKAVSTPNNGVLKYPGDVNRACTYDESNLDYNLPSNFMAGNCERNDNVKQLNNELFTSTVTPGVYYKTQIIEPLNWNVGISFDQQIPPRKTTVDKNGDVTYTAMDPSLYNPEPVFDKNDYGTAPYEVYDPRTNGYGTSYRDYIHDVTGQPRFYYDDVNAARRPNYITRTNIDHLLKADSYGIVQDTNNIMSRNCDSRNIAEQGISNDTIDFRTDLMTRLMRKRNAELWQQRMAPIQKGANFVMR
jgi:hypothetical protein